MLTNIHRLHSFNCLISFFWCWCTRCFHLFLSTSLLASESGENNTLREKRHYYSDLDFLLSYIYILDVLPTCQGLSLDTTVQVTQSYIHCIMWKNVFGTQGQWRILIIHCRPWKPSGPSPALPSILLAKSLWPSLSYNRHRRTFRSEERITS